MRPPCGATLNVRKYYSSGNIGGRPPPMVITSNVEICSTTRGKVQVFPEC